MSRHRALIVSGAAAALFLGLTLLVAVGATQDLDDAAKELFRPGDMWSTPQHAVGDVIDGLKPAHVLVVGAAAAGWSAWERRSLLPVVGLATAMLVTAAATWVTKQLLDRPDTHGFDSGGSYPSGHVAVLLVGLGCLTILSTRRRWWMWLATAVVVAVMALSLLVQATHWLSDIAGGALLGSAVLAALWAAGERRRVGQGLSTEPLSWP